ncbi:MAG TPA: YciI family protein [Candidatus Sulfopaludibacter sp.]|jgi:hypothetical protein|nr:YciI family protein [Candidatus Sulfopaludibacter sp.]
MENYLLLLHGNGRYSTLSPEEMQATFARYRNWGQKLREAGRMAGSNKLEDGSGRVLSGQNGGLHITDGPYAETKDVVGGYYLINAESYEEAVELARDCPHVDFGVIEIRRVEKM